MRRRLNHLKFKVALLAAGAWHTARWWGTRRREAAADERVPCPWCNDDGVVHGMDGTPLGDCQDCPT